MRRVAAILSAALVLAGLTVSPAFAPELRTTFGSSLALPGGQQSATTVEAQWRGLNQAEAFLANLDWRFVPPSGRCDPQVQYFQEFFIDGQPAPDVLDEIQCLPDGPLSWVMQPFMFEVDQLFEIELSWIHMPVPEVDGCWVPGVIAFPSDQQSQPTGPEVSGDVAPYAWPDDDDPNCPPANQPQAPGVGTKESPEPVAPTGTTVGSNQHDFFVLDQLPPPGQPFDLQLQCGAGDDFFEIQLPDQLPPDPIGGTIQVDTGGGLDTILLPPQFDFFNGTLEILTTGDLVLLMPDPFWAERGQIDIVLMGSDPIDLLIQRPPDPFDRAELALPQQLAVEIQITDLSLASVQPFEVSIDGQDAREWMVEVDIDLPELPTPTQIQLIDLTVPDLNITLGEAADILRLDNVLLPPPLDPLGAAPQPWVISMGGGPDVVGLELMTQGVLLPPQPGANGRAASAAQPSLVSIDAGPGDDRVVGGPGPDVINGGDGHDLLDGGPGPDVINGGPGADICHGRGGLDTLTSCENDPRGPSVTPRNRAGLGTALSASDNVSSAIAWSQHGFPVGGAGEALLGRDDVFADPLSSGFAQGVLDAPLLLTPPASLDPRVLAELERLGVRTVHLLGGPNALQDAVRQELEDEGYTVTRTFGTNRVRTAVAVATAFGNPTESDVVLARAFGSDGDETRAFVDSLAAGALAASQGWPLLLTETATLNPDTREYLVDVGVERVWIAGGPGAVGAAVADELVDLGIDVRRRSGNNRFRTAAVLGTVTMSDGAPDEVVVVDGTNPNAWAHGLPAARTGAPVALASGANLSPAAAAQLAGARDLGARVVCAPGVQAGACAQADAIASTRHWSGFFLPYAAGQGPSGVDAVATLQVRGNQPWVCASWRTVGGPALLDLRVVSGSNVVELVPEFRLGGQSHGCSLRTNEVAGQIGGGRLQLFNQSGVWWDEVLWWGTSRGIAVVPGGVVDVIFNEGPRACVHVLHPARSTRVDVVGGSGSDSIAVADGINCEEGGDVSPYDNFLTIGAALRVFDGATEVASGFAHVPGA